MADLWEHDDGEGGRLSIAIPSDASADILVSACVGETLRVLVYLSRDDALGLISALAGSMRKPTTL